MAYAQEPRSVGAVAAGVFQARDKCAGIAQTGYRWVGYRPGGGVSARKDHGIDGID